MPENIVLEGSSTDKNYLQTLSEKPLVTLDEWFGNPEDTNTNLGIIADLVANNRMSPETEEKIKSLQLQGNLIGIGTASIFSMMYGFKECKSFVSLDIHPQPVAIGRMSKDLFIKHEKFEDFLSSLSDSTNVQYLLRKQRLPSKYMASALRSVKEAVTQYKDAGNNRNGRKKDGMHLQQDGMTVLLPLQAIHDNYDQLRTVATEGNMHFLQDDFFWPGFWEKLNKNMPTLKTDTNLIYMSNGLDHVVRSAAPLWQRWQEEEKFEHIQREMKAIGDVVPYNFRGWEHSSFVFTLTSEKYNLRFSSTPPKFTFDKQQELVTDL